jgi:hypothetical protein
MREHLGVWWLSHVSQKKRDMGHPAFPKGVGFANTPSLGLLGRATCVPA